MTSSMGRLFITSAIIQTRQKSMDLRYPLGAPSPRRIGGRKIGQHMKRLVGYGEPLFTLCKKYQQQDNPPTHWAAQLPAK